MQREPMGWIGIILYIISALIVIFTMSSILLANTNKGRVDRYKNKCNELNMKLSHMEVNLNNTKYIKLICISKEINSKKYVSIMYKKLY